MDLAAFIAPYPLERFIGETYDRTPLHITAEGESGERRRMLLSWARMNDLLGIAAQWGQANVKLILNGAVAAHRWSGSPFDQDGLGQRRLRSRRGRSRREGRGARRRRRGACRVGDGGKQQAARSEQGRGDEEMTTGDQRRLFGNALSPGLRGGRHASLGRGESKVAETVRSPPCCASGQEGSTGLIQI